MILRLNLAKLFQNVCVVDPHGGWLWFPSQTIEFLMDTILNHVITSPVKKKVNKEHLFALETVFHENVGLCADCLQR